MKNEDTVQSPEVGRFPSPPRTRRFRWVILGAALFICGGLVGSVVTKAVIERGILRALRNPEAMSEGVVAQMRGELKLSDSQTREALTIVKKHFTTLSRSTRETFTEMHIELRGILNKEQVEKHDRKENELRRTLFGSSEDEK